MRSLGAAVCLLAMAGLVEAAGPSGETVGRYGDPLRLVVRGAEHFPPEKVKHSLVTDLDVLLAAHPAAPLRQYLSTLHDKATAGYLRAGFRDVKVTASVDKETGGTIVTVEEGPQCLAGEVRIVGARDVPAKFLVERLTQEFPPTQATASASGSRMSDLEGNEIEPEIALWPPGKPAALDAERKVKITKRVRDALEGAGRFSADFAIEFPRSSPTTVDLLVRIADEGPQAKADAIEVAGNRRHTSHEILDYLGVKPGMPLTRQVCADMEYRLWQSGRFRWQKVAPTVPDAPGGPLQLRIEVEEYDKAPRLSEKLSEVDEVMLRCQHWMSGLPLTDDIVLEGKADDAPISIVFSPAKGALIQGGDHAAIITGDQTGFYSFSERKKLVASPAQRPLKVNFGFRLARERDASDKPLSFLFGAGMDCSSSIRPGAPLDLLVCVPPSTSIALTREGNTDCSIAGGVLTILRESSQVQVDVTSGRLIGWTVSPQGNRTPIRIAVKPGEFNRRLCEIEDQAADYPNAYDPLRPVSSWVQFLRDDELAGKASRWLWGNAVTTPPPDGKQLEVLWKIVDGAVLEPWDRRIAHRASSSQPNRLDFSIPGGRGLNNILSFDDPKAVPMTLCFLGADFLFPRGSWPSTLVRETGLSIAGRSDPKYFYAELTDLYASSKTGPICCLVGAAAFHSTLPRTAGGFAQKGLQRLSVEDFRKDRDVLLDREHYLFPAVLAVVGALRTLDESETEVLLTGLPPDIKAGIQAGLARLRERSDVPTADLLDDALDDAWQGGWQSATERALRSMLVGLTQN